MMFEQMINYGSKFYFVPMMERKNFTVSELAINW